MYYFEKIKQYFKILHCQLASYTNAFYFANKNVEGKVSLKYCFKQKSLYNILNYKHYAFWIFITTGTFYSHQTSLVKSVFACRTLVLWVLPSSNALKTVRRSGKTVWRSNSLLSMQCCMIHWLCEPLFCCKRAMLLLDSLW